MSLSAEKCKRADHSGFINILMQNVKKPFGHMEKFRKKCKVPIEGHALVSTDFWVTLKS